MNINETTYENYFLLYIDNELTPEQKLEIDAFVIANPVYASFLSELKNAKLEVSDEVFEDKALLYRFPEMDAKLAVDFKQSLYRHQQAPIIKTGFNKKMYRATLSIAALFFLFIGYRFYTTSNENYNGTEVATNRIIEIKPIIPTTDKLKPAHLIKDQIARAAAINVLKNAISSKNLSTTPVYEKIGVSNNAQLISSNTTINQNASIIAGSIMQGMESSYSNTNTEASTTEVASSNAFSNKNDNSNTNPTHTTELANTNTSYDEIETDRADRIIYISGLEIDGDKLRGFTRKVNALFKRNKTDREK